MQSIVGCGISQNVVIAMSGIAKVFIGEIIEEGKWLAHCWLHCACIVLLHHGIVTMITVLLLSDWRHRP